MLTSLRGLPCMCVLGSIGALASLAPAADEVVAALPWRGDTAGYVGQLFESTALNDRWLIEDFSTEVPIAITTFSSIGFISPPGSQVFFTDFEAVILDAMPPEGRVVMESVIGEGSYTTIGLDGRYETTFDGKILPPGDYVILFAARVPTDSARAIFWHQPGAHILRGGLPDNGWAWEPATATLTPLARTLGGSDRSGVNFTLRGTIIECRADIDGDGELTIFDFLNFQNKFAAGDPLADFDGDGELTIFDFLDFQNAFAAGCG